MKKPARPQQHNLDATGPWVVSVCLFELGIDWRAWRALREKKVEFHAELAKDAKEETKKKPFSTGTD